jgi:FkbM family methyltransferase
VSALRTLAQIGRDLRGAKELAADASSFRRYAADVFLHRLLRVLPLTSGALRRIRVRGGTELTYRRNRGDIYTIREVWIDEAYRLPGGFRPSVVVDLGAHIGLVSLWFARQYAPRLIVAVEPLASNAELARENLARNGVRAEVIEAAVGETDGTVRFQEAPDSNKGRVAVEGRPVRMVSVATVLASIPDGGEIDLLKMDIEGAEEAVLAGETPWLGRVRSVLAELHPNVDRAALTHKLEAEGLLPVPLAHGHARELACFMRPEVTP